MTFNPNNGESVLSVGNVFPEIAGLSDRWRKCLKLEKDMSGPLLFPSLLPRIVDRLWFNVDKPCDDENELSKLEDEQQDWVTGCSCCPSAVREALRVREPVEMEGGGVYPNGETPHHWQWQWHQSLLVLVFTVEGRSQGDRLTVTVCCKNSTKTKWFFFRPSKFVFLGW